MNAKPLLFALLLGLTLGLAVQAQAEDKTVNFWITFVGVDRSHSDSNPADMLVAKDRFVQNIYDSTGLTVALKIAPGVNVISNRFLEGQADAAFMPRVDYYVARKMGMPITAWLAPILSGQTTDRACLWVREEMAGKPLLELKGISCGLGEAPDTDFSKWDQVWSFAPLWDYLTFRWALDENGFHEPIQDFCGPLKLDVADGSSGLTSLAMGRLDIIVATQTTYERLKSRDDKMDGIHPIACAPEGPPPPFVRRSDLDPEIVRSLETALDKLASQPGYSSLKTLFQIDGFIRVDDEDYDVYAQWFDECIQRGYLEEFKYFTELSDGDR